MESWISAIRESMAREMQNWDQICQGSLAVEEPEDVIPVWTASYVAS
jgi:hypothetical protein